MGKTERKFAICGLLNIDGLNIGDTISVADDLAALYNALDSFLSQAPLLAKEIQDRTILVNREAVDMRMASLGRMFRSIGATMLSQKLHAIELAITRRDLTHRNALIMELEEPVFELCQKIEECRPMKRPAGNDKEERETPTEKLSEVIDQTIHNKVPNILIVDDITVVLNTVISILKDRYVVHGLPRGAMVPKLLKNTKIDLFLLDIEMPGMDGYALFEKIRQLPLYKHTPIMFFTSHVNMDYLKAANGLGAAGYIKKPVEPALLIEKVETCLALQDNQAMGK